MSEMISAKEAATRWGLSERRVTGFCTTGKIPGAEKTGRSWAIPADATKPVDGRVKTEAFRQTAAKKADRLPPPVGVSDYRLASTEYYYIDKTLLIRDFLDERPMVSLFTRPRRFGKTMNMDMLRTFFEKTEEDTSRYFTDKKIWACGEKYRSYQGRYPVIYLSFKDMKYGSWEETLEDMQNVFAQEFKRHSVLLTSDRLDETEKAYFEKIIRKGGTMIDLTHALEYLSQMLHAHYSECAVIIVDEYDTPIQQGHTKGFYEEVISFMHNLLSGGFKDNKHLAYGFLTGILCVARESIFSGLNNLAIHSVLDKKYSEYFGFTAGEVREMAAYYEKSEKFDEICAWYGGYRFGNTEIFHPWSVINYFSNDCEPRAFWLSTGSNDIIGKVISQADDEICRELTSLINGKSFTTYIDTSVIYPQIRSKHASIYSFLLVAGYLKVTKPTTPFDGDYMCEVALPNREITLVYQKEILQKLEHVIPQSTAISVQEAIFSGDGERLKTLIRTLLIQSVSSFDTAKETFYHGFMLGICALLGGAYTTSDRESGTGRYGIQLCPTAPQFPGILIELKAGQGCSASQLQFLSETALKQINDREYDAELRARGVETVYKYGVAFSGKNVEVAVG